MGHELNGRAEAGGTLPDMLDVVIVGAGFAGMYMLHRARGLGLSAVVLDTAGGVGGTWYWNRYPGARCDVESMQYSYSFSHELQQEWVWSERYASQPEILEYANYVAKRFDLLRDIRFNTRVDSIDYRDDEGRWLLTTANDETLSGRFCVMATGCLSAPLTPQIKGLNAFQGNVYHTGSWPHDDVDFAGQQVGVIGTGSSGIQVTPELAKQAEHLYVFQRTPNFSVPARNRPMSPDYEADWKRNYSERRAQARTSPNGILPKPSDVATSEVSAAERQAEFEKRWAEGGTGFMSAYKDLMRDEEANAAAAGFVHDKIRETVDDSAIAERLMPKQYPIGAKRICADTNYFETFNRENVTLVDVRAEPISHATADGLVTGSNRYVLDSLVLATGFDAMTGALSKIDIVGRQRTSLRDKWKDGPQTYLGMMTAQFPNLFIVTGPGSPSVMTNVIVAIEDNIDWITSCISHLEKIGAQSIEASPTAEENWMQHVADEAAKTLFTKADSWYLGANKSGKPRVFMPYVGGIPKYQRICDEVASDGYRGFEIRTKATAAVL